MRGASKAVLGGLAVVAAVGTGVTAFQIDDEIVTRVETDVASLWVPAPVSGEVVELDALTGDVVGRVEVAEAGSELDVAATPEGVVVVDRGSGTVSLVDPALQEVRRTVEAGPGLEQVDIGDGGTAVSEDDAVRLIGPDVRTVAAARVARPPTDLVADGNGAQAIVQGAVIRIDVDGSTSSFGTDADRLVRVGGEVLRLVGQDLRDPGDARVGCLSETPTDDAHVAGGTSTIAVTGEQQVLVADLTAESCATVRLDPDTGPLGRPVIAEGVVFVPEVDTGRVHIIDVETAEATVHPVARGAQQLRLVSDGHSVAVYDQGSSFVALLGPDGVDRFVDTAEGAAGVEAVLGDEGAAGVASEGPDTEGETPVTAASVLAATIRQPDPDPEPEATPPDETGELVANFAFSADTVTVGEAVRFVDGSSGDPNAWVWDFGDGSGAEGPTVQKAWSEPGTYLVTLTVFDDTGEDSIGLAVTVVEAGVELPPVADFAVSSQVVTVGEPVVFSDRSSGAVDTWRWDFGDGAVAATPDVTHVFETPGRYAVRLTVSNEQGSDSAQLVVDVSEGLQAPVVEARVESVRLEAGQSIRFSAESTTDPAVFAWDFGDGSTGTGDEVRHVYDEAGTYTVVVTGVNSAGEDSVTLEVEVVPGSIAPVARIGTLPAIIEAGDAVTLTSLSTNAPTSETWSLGDGTTASGPEIEHTWGSPGTYVVALTVANAAGEDTATVTVVVIEELPAPVAAIGAFTPDPWVGDVVTFADASVDASEWLWDFGDGVTSTVQNPIHTFTESGATTVTLTVSNRKGTDSTSVVVVPRLQPSASFSFAPLGPTAGEPISFVDQSANAASWVWDFGDGTTSELEAPSHTYDAAGIYDVTLTVATAAGDVDTTTLPLSVDPAPPVPVLDIDPSPGTTGEAVTFTATPAATSGPIIGYELDYGDGILTAVSPSGSFTHTYAAEGSYTVRVRATGPVAVSDWVSTTLVVDNPPPPAVSIDAPSGATVLANVDLDGVVEPGSGPIEDWSWSFTQVGGGSAPADASGQSVTVAFPEAGQYRIELTVTGPFDDTTETQLITISLPAPPSVASVSATPNPAPTGGVVNFDASVSASVVRWEWDFEDDGSYVDLGSDSANWQHAFNTAGAQTVRLRVFDAFDQTASGSVVVTVIQGPDPTPIVVSPSSGVLVGTPVSLSTDDANGLGGLTWEWRLTLAGQPDVVVGGEDIVHAFTAAGVWTVTVTATDGFGRSSSEVTTVAVDAPPVAAFSHVVGGLTVDFTDQSTTNGGSPITSWSWDFGDGGTSGDPNPSYTYAAPGDYSVTLTVTSAVGSDSVVVTVSVL